MMLRLCLFVSVLIASSTAFEMTFKQCDGKYNFNNLQAHGYFTGIYKQFGSRYTVAIPRDLVLRSGAVSPFDLSFHEGGLVTAVVANHCIQEPCTVYRGQDYTGYVNFTTTKDAHQVHAVLHGKIGFVNVPWSVQNPDLCVHDLPCPLRAGHTYQYKLDMLCPIIAPQVRITAKWELQDEHGNNIICFTIPLQIN